MTAAGPAVSARPAQGRAGLRAGFLAAALALGAGGGVLVHAAAAPRGPAAPALPELHGQLSWDAGARPAPAFRLHGSRLSTSLRGRTVVVAFEPPACGARCASLRQMLASIVRGLAPADRPAVVTVGGVGPLAAASPDAVRRSFGVPRRAALVYLLDRRGDERTGYLFPFAPAFVQGDLRTLAREGS